MAQIETLRAGLQSAAAALAACHNHAPEDQREAIEIFFKEARAALEMASEPPAPAPLFILTCANHDGEVTGCYAFSTHDKATAALRAIIAADWEAGTPEEDDGEPQPMPDDIDDAQNRLAEWADLNPWTIHAVKVDEIADPTANAA